MTGERIAITGIGSISPIGGTSEEVWQRYLDADHCFTEQEDQGRIYPVALVGKKEMEKIDTLRSSDHRYKDLDLSVLFAIEASRRAVQGAGWTKGDHFGVNIGSSRGATGLFEKYHETYLDKGYAPTLTSPTTTLGNIASWVGHDLQADGPVISHSITCSTALHAVLNGYAWLRSGLTDKFLAGGSEASLTPFTLAQMRSLKIYASAGEQYPCKALDMAKRRNTMVLGEGASVICMESKPHTVPLGYIKGIGYATERLKHNISISSDAKCFQKSMRMALGELSPQEVDVVVMHAPGTIKGDASELKAIEAVFGNSLPAVTSNKWKIGHTFGASGALSLELGLLMLKHQQFIGVPFTRNKDFRVPKTIRKVMVNAVGFGGNAVSVLLEGIW
ncbi:beta-ketoacyl synthase [Robertkochia marina]|uniref:Beta-ketoacyl synthase n=1 Tax=Robertkochia marina TaxID=1227945 RepID=A0A4S3M5C9_9FLAO|nr:beta-ketoacyl synthase N-terminal-like domain-containing protein [Robertkochia marina]THD69541.1 beta-ketoacyl synthase [Robertkochia marina]TRZ47201.1 beta-ketoacyl synthase [Robertkochia marina]